jgi:peptide/nickel transport system substrate-binding protein
MRKKMISKLLAGVLTAAMLITGTVTIGTLTGCGSSSGNETADSGDSGTEKDAGTDTDSGKADTDKADNNSEDNAESPSDEDTADTTLVYGSNDYTRINPAIDEHGEINLLLFDGLMAHDADNNVVEGLAESYEYDEGSNTYTFHLRENVKWHDGEPFTADDVKFTIEAIKNPDNESEIYSNYVEVSDIKVVDEHTVQFVLSEKNAAFLEYMTIGILPKHLLEGKSMQEDEYFHKPVGTGPYKLEEWDEGQSITLVRNDDYYKGAPKIGKIIFKIVPDDNVKALQLEAGEIDMAKITPKDAKNFEGKDDYKIYNMKTSDYRGIMYNFNNQFWKDNADIIPGINYGIDREAMVSSVLLGQGITAYGPLQRNKYNNENVEHYDYNKDKAREVFEKAGWKLGDDGIYEKDGKKLSFTINVMEGDQVRADLAAVAAQQLKEVGVDVKAEVQSEIDWDNQEAFLIGWGSPFDADDHTYKVFGTDQGANYNAYSNADVDKYLKEARQTFDDNERKEAYAKYQEAMAKNPAYTFFCYIDVDYVAVKGLSGISENTVLGHHGVGIFWNVNEWSIEK